MNKPVTVYLAGPMTGIPDYNFPLFFQVEHELHCQGYRVENPAKNNGDTLSEALADVRETALTWAEYMKRDLVRLAKSDAVCLLPGWQNSKGATLEVHIARALGMDIYQWYEGTLCTVLREVAA